MLLRYLKEKHRCHGKGWDELLFFWFAPQVAWISSIAVPVAKGKANSKICYTTSISLTQLGNIVDRLEEHRGWVDFAEYACIIRDCCNLKALSEGKRVHLHMTKRKVEKHTFLSNLLITMYGKCGRPEEARKVFNAMLERDVVSWNLMISANAKNDRRNLALNLFWQMQKEGISPNTITFVSVLSACDSPETLVDGKAIHSRFVSSGLDPDTNITMALLRMYGQEGNRAFLGDAKGRRETG